MPNAFISHLTPEEAVFVKHLMACPEADRPQAYARLGDLVWGTIRLHIKSRVLVAFADMVWGLLKLDLLHRQASSKVSPRRRSLAYHRAELN